MPKGSIYDNEFKMEVVLEVLKGNKPSDVAEKYGVSRNSIYAWKNQFLDGGLKNLGNKKQIESQKDVKLREKEQQIDEMKKIIGEQKVQLEILTTQL